MCGDVAAVYRPNTCHSCLSCTGIATVGWQASPLPWKLHPSSRLHGKDYCLFSGLS